jgi:hypothetical protein
LDGKEKESERHPFLMCTGTQEQKKSFEKGFSFSQTIAGSSSSRMVVACVLKENGLRM